MPKSLHAVDYLSSAGEYPPRPVCVLFGDDDFFKRQVLVRLRQAVLGGGDGDLSFTTFEGRTALLRDVLDELATLAMFALVVTQLAVTEAQTLNRLVAWFAIVLSVAAGVSYLSRFRRMANTALR